MAGHHQRRNRMKNGLKRRGRVAAAAATAVVLSAAVLAGQAMAQGVDNTSTLPSGEAALYEQIREQGPEALIEIQGRASGELADRCLRESDRSTVSECEAEVTAFLQRWNRWSSEIGGLTTGVADQKRMASAIACLRSNGLVTNPEVVEAVEAGDMEGAYVQSEVAETLSAANADLDRALRSEGRLLLAVELVPTDATLQVRRAVGQLRSKLNTWTALSESPSVGIDFQGWSEAASEAEAVAALIEANRSASANALRALGRFSTNVMALLDADRTEVEAAVATIESRAPSAAEDLARQCNVDQPRSESPDPEELVAWLKENPAAVADLTDEP